MVTICNGNLGTAIVMIKGFNLYKLDCGVKSCQWTQLTQTLNQNRHRSVAMVVPDDIVTCG
jgi:hypothetical protein